MTFLHSFFSDSTAFILSVDIHHLFDMICAPPIRDQRDNPASCPNHSYWKMQIFFLIHSYTYVVPISPVPKYSGGHSSEKKKKKKVVWKVLKVLLLIVYGTFCPPICDVQFASVHLCTVSLWGGQPAATQRASSQSLRVSLPDRPLRLHDRICCFALWSIKIWEVHSSRRPIHSRARSVQVFFFFFFF